MKKELIARGAEAELYLSSYLGRKTLIKNRVRKKYRDPVLDERIRKERTRIECLMLHKAKEIGVRVPVIYKIDEAGKAIWMEFIEGEKVKDILNEGNISLCKRIGEMVGQMHSADLIHGDLTTSNVLLHNGELVFIDFGLASNSRKTEAKAVDLLVFKKTFDATHFKLKKGWKSVLTGYLGANSEGKGVIEKISAVESRARYH